MKLTASLRLVAMTALVSPVLALTSAAEESISLGFQASVPTSCEIGDVEVLPGQQGSTVRIATVCNALSFTLNFEGVPDLGIGTARAGVNAQSDILVLADGVIVNAARPGYQIVEIDLANDPASLDQLAIDVVAG